MTSHPLLLPPFLANHPIQPFTVPKNRPNANILNVAARFLIFIGFVNDFNFHSYNCASSANFNPPPIQSLLYYFSPMNSKNHIQTFSRLFPFFIGYVYFFLNY